ERSHRLILTAPPAERHRFASGAGARRRLCEDRMDRARPPCAELLDFLKPFDPSVGELALAVRALVLEEAPLASELVYDAYNAVALGYTFTGRLKEGFCHVAVYSRHVNLGF